MTRKLTTGINTSAPFIRKPETPRQLTSEAIDRHIAAFEAAGGKVQVLPTRPSEVAAQAAAQAAALAEAAAQKPKAEKSAAVSAHAEPKTEA